MTAISLTDARPYLAVKMAPESCDGWIDLNGCDAGMHYWKRDDRDVLQCFHSDDTPCKRAEYKLPGME